MIRPTHWVAGAATTALAASGLALVAPAPALAAAPAAAPVLAWEISQQFDDHLSTHVLADGATETTDGVITFPAGVGSFDSGTGAASIAYDGSVAGSFAMAGTTYYTVTVADPTVTVAADGAGVLTAVVSASNAAQGSNPAAATEPKRVTVSTFDAPDWTTGDGLGSITATPDWAGVLAADSPEAAALGIGAGKPVDGKSFHRDFLGQLTSGVRAHFYASGASSDVKKAPASLTAQATQAPPAVEVTTVSASYADGLELSVAGTGFTAVTNPGDAGVYVGLAESGGIPDTGSQEGQSAFAAAAWVSPAQMPGGEFTAGLVAPTAKLDPTREYSVYTWQAHSHSNPTQDTETRIEVDWSQLAAPAPVKTKPTATVKVLTKPTPKKAGKVKVVLSGKAGAATGTVKVQVAKKSGKVVKTRSAKLAKGKATVALPKLPKGSYTVKATYAGSAAYRAVSRTVRLKVTR
ncbi:HtaA domain-containing protein [Nocardioides dongkuii]|uniref:HtaA domain-containing protein n=1 Tax=Nocardioides dongkuii TaxID=2760089 RepID=UPI0018775887|nr:HtaA domain-containing protein [Nocardioides dongkuii]